MNTYLLCSIIVIHRVKTYSHAIVPLSSPWSCGDVPLRSTFKEERIALVVIKQSPASGFSLVTESNSLNGMPPEGDSQLVTYWVGDKRAQQCLFSVIFHFWISVCCRGPHGIGRGVVSPSSLFKLSLCPFLFSLKLFLKYFAYQTLRLSTCL